MPEERPIFPAPKPQSTKKKGGTKKAPTKTTSPPLNRTRQEINATNRQRGKSAERQVAKRTGGSTTPLSGAIKNSVKGLEGDVRVRDESNSRDFLVIECKSASQLTPKGDKSFTVHQKVVRQMIDEAEKGGCLGTLYIHWVNGGFDEDLVMFKSSHFFELVRLARIGAECER